MKSKDQYKRLLHALAAAVILALLTACFAAVWFGPYREVGADQFVRGNYVLIGLYALTVFSVFYILGGFKVGHARVFEILYSQILSTLIVNAISYLQISLILRWAPLTHIEPMLVLTAGELAAVLTWSFAFRGIFRLLYPPRKMLLVYGSYSPDNLIRKIRTRDDRYDVHEAIPIDAPPELIRQKILENQNVVLTDIPAEIRNELLKYCFEKDIRCYCVPKISDVMIRSAQSIHLMDTTLLLFRNMGLSADQKCVKRIFDALTAVVALVLMSPLMALIALGIKLCDGGSVLFSQERLTEGGRVFKLYKFRSMRIEAQDAPYVLTRKNDARVTSVGRLLRATHLDELPQLFNILRGDMSFVGPRPECPELAEEYAKALPEFSYRLKVKAGLTGFAQVYGKYNTTPYDKLKLDLHYIENYSPALDLKLMLLTLRILFRKENTEGIEPWQTSAAREEECIK